MKLKLTRHSIIVIVCLALVFSAGVLAHSAWSNKVLHDRAVATAQRQVESYKAKKRAEHVAEETAKLKAECDKEVKYYNGLTALQKKTVVAPACQNLAIVE